jgi:hypothetical protein
MKAHLRELGGFHLDEGAIVDLGQSPGDFRLARTWETKKEISLPVKEGLSNLWGPP